MKDQSPVVQEELVAESFEEEQLGWVWQQGWMMKGQWCPEKRNRLGFPRVVVAVGQVDSELSQFMLSVRVCHSGRNPSVDQVCNLLSSILGVVGLVQQLSILSGFAR